MPLTLVAKDGCGVMMHTITVRPGNHKIVAPSGLLVKEVLASRQLMPNDFPCGGNGTCGKCIIHVKYTGQEEAIPVLACQTRITEDIEVILDERHTCAGILVTGDGQPVRPEPVVAKQLIPLRKIPDCRDTWTTISSYLEAKSPGPRKISLKALRQLALLDSSKVQAVTVVTYYNEVIAIEPEDTIQQLYGMAFDIGTTTVVGYLYDLNTGTQLATASCLNAQITYGADVISRIVAAGREPAELTKLQLAVVDCVNKLINDACNLRRVNPHHIYDLVMAGNTCMHHLFFGINPSSLGRAPYKPIYRNASVEEARRLGVIVNPAARIHWLPGVAGFVGADTVALLVAHPPANDNKIRLAVDIGTNGEIVLSAGGRLWSCSTAAGPAFEGATISQGTRAVNGAIDHVFVENNDLQYTTMNGEEAVGICGSGIVDAVAAMLQCGLLSSPGAIIHSGNPLLDSRIVEKEGQPAVRIAGTGPATMVSITQEDIRQLQLAKAAIRAGIDYLSYSAGILAEDVDEILLAGAFGNYVNPESAIAIGLLPAAFAGKIRPVGNAAGTGAQAALISRSKRAFSETIAEQIQYVELAGKPDFQNYYIDALLFGNEPED